MQYRLWDFIDDCGSFQAKGADKLRSLYFPLANEAIMSSITPLFHGDIKSGQNSFLLPPVSRIDLLNSRVSRNFWVYIDKNKVWSACGVSKDYKRIAKDKFDLTAGLLWQKVTRENSQIGLRAEILSFNPSSNDPVEIMRLRFTNIGKKTIKFTPTAAIPIYARGADSIRDHRHVTSLLQRVIKHKFGVISKPTLVFDESGHKSNKDYYFVLGWDGKLNPPQYFYPTQEMFCGENGDLEAPETVLNNSLPSDSSIQGKESMGALRFKSVILPPGKSVDFNILMGIVNDIKKINPIVSKFREKGKIDQALNQTKDFWVEKTRHLDLSTGDPDFDNWFRWVSIQPNLRRIFGCSFLPDFDYGKGGRGWRDLWQDCLGLILSNPQEVRQLLINNFAGVRIDGSNATIIGKRHGEFIADRNGIPRVWMDHGVWPLITVDLYLNETGDFDLLFEKTTYFRNFEICRSRDIDRKWNRSYGQNLKSIKGEIYKGSIIEHLLVENIVQFYNVGSHNHVRLEGADWNDGLDMAKENGESVAFSSMYAHNLNLLAELLLKTGWENLEVAREIKILLKEFNYNNVVEKLGILDEYFTKTKIELSGKTIDLDVVALARNLKSKSEWMMEHIRKTEWQKEGFFNGYYDNHKERVEGKKDNQIRMSLTAQVFPIMSRTAKKEHVQAILKSTRKYLFDKKLQGYHLNTNFNAELYNFGRAFSFVYGDKENGAVFNHMVVMFAYSLYKQGYVKEGWEVLSSIYKMSRNTQASKIYPCLPEYFDLQGKGMYSYLTGSASWFVFTMLTQVFGVKGKDGDLLIKPKFSPAQFVESKKLSVNRVFAGRNLEIVFSFSKKPVSRPKIIRAFLDKEEITVDDPYKVRITRSRITALAKEKSSKIEIILS